MAPSKAQSSFDTLSQVRDAHWPQICFMLFNTEQVIRINPYVLIRNPCTSRTYYTINEHFYIEFLKLSLKYLVPHIIQKTRYAHVSKIYDH